MSWDDVQMFSWEATDVAVAAATGWNTPQQVETLGSAGRFTRAVLLGAPSAAATLVDLLVYGGPDYDATTDPATVPDEDRFLEIQDIAVSSSATDPRIIADLDLDDDATKTVNLANALYRVSQSEHIWLAIKTKTGSADTDYVVRLFAEGRP